MLLIGRSVVGVGIGLAEMAVPIYIVESAPAHVRGKRCPHELAPAHIRGKLVVGYVVLIAGGQFVATRVRGMDYKIGWRYIDSAGQTH